MLIIQCCFVAIHATNKNAQLYNSNVNQLVTSSTLAWHTVDNNQDVQHMLPFAVEAAKYHSEQENYPNYVCRFIDKGIAVPGHTQKHDSRTVCVVATHLGVSQHHIYELLQNTGNGGKLTWKPWNKYSVGIPNGAVSATSAGHVSNIDSIFLDYFPLDLVFIASKNYSKVNRKLNDLIIGFWSTCCLCDDQKKIMRVLVFQLEQADDNYVARRKTHSEGGHEQHHHHHGGIDYNVGRFAPKISLGKVIVPVNNAERVWPRTKFVYFFLNNLQLSKLKSYFNEIAWKL